jgi:putrescine transport system ATP-binding protein
MVTHDQEEAMTMANRIAHHGCRPHPPDRHARRNLRSAEFSRYTAEFIGSVNLFDGASTRTRRTTSPSPVPALPDPIYVGSWRHRLRGTWTWASRVRPEKIKISKDEPEQPHNKAQGKIEDIAYFGSHSVYHVRLPMAAQSHVPTSPTSSAGRQRGIHLERQGLGVLGRQRRRGADVMTARAAVERFLPGRAGA